MLLRIENIPRPYDWGSTTAIAELLGTAPSGRPEAELWLGDHPGSPARIVGGSDEPDLAAYLSARGEKLPFLLKVLAAAEPLSLQAHPTIAQAREGFARENAAGIALDDPTRNYKDELHKPELIYALSDPFIALAGFRPIDEARAELQQAANPVEAEHPGAGARLAPLLDRLTGDDALPEVVRWLIGRGEGVAELVDAVTDHARRLEHRPLDTESWATVRRLAHHYPGDPGIVLSMLMHTVVLRPGEALYLPTGNIHSYQQGLAIEVMAASDNVLRGGLSPKHVDVPELMTVLDTRPVPEPRIAPRTISAGVQRFEPDVVDFALTVIDTDAAHRGVTVDSRGHAIALCLEGRVRLQGSLALERGQAAFCDDAELSIRGEGRVVVATGEHPAA
ncbi:mannose-6-phosphate isomerase, class I [Microcella sp.]|uniref:mannose-6-phosphate isomerase, class I n=1 Tax=Microcella sp. TaxID=1913979 RepID=UPI0025627381|nr:mannose-6-phosphate isomerase, class I [Microcella sp.]MBX9472746.1 mannose-6-phosphate isomerase, class I [Microcella sp.]